MVLLNPACATAALEDHSSASAQPRAHRNTCARTRRAPTRCRLSHLPISAPLPSSISNEISTILEMTMLEMSCCLFDGFSPHSRREGRREERWEVGCCWSDMEVGWRRQEQIMEEEEDDSL
ncbi:hypothetical protein C2S51_008924 [Perilla frutescens var. frutescens]|nr:hypothetical protein C2S51_008924 [Perilla frutescens var. frutescens]